MKLDASIDAIGSHRLAGEGGFAVGKGGWAMLAFRVDDPSAADDLARWITESFRLLVPKRVSSQLDD